MGFVGELSGVWNRTPRGQKTMLLALGGGAIALFMLFTSWSRSPEFVPLYSGLDPADAGAIVDQLLSEGIPHEVANGGTTVRVPSSQVASARVNLAAMGLPSGGSTGFEIFDSQSFGVTDFVQRINLRRSLEGELTRTINQLDPVLGSRVHIALPESRLFSADQAETSASIVLDVRPGRNLSAQQVQGVAHLVSQSVEGLTPENVTILNSNGDIIFDGSDDLGVGGGTQLQMTQAFESQMESDLQSFLRSVLGPNRAAVEVSAILDFTKVETSTESFTPIEGGNPSTQSVAETFVGSGAAEALNVPGASANVPGTPTPEAEGETGNESSNYSRTESTVNNELDRRVQTITTSPGTVTSLSIAVLLDESVPEEEATALQAAVASAAGLDTSRGDTITLGQVPFDTSELEEATAAIEAETAANAQMNMIRMAVPVLAVLLAGGFFSFFIRKLGGDGAPGAADQLSLAIGPGGMPALGPAETVEQMQARMMTQATMRQRDAKEQELTQLVQTQPKAVAEVVRAWTREDG